MKKIITAAIIIALFSCKSQTMKQQDETSFYVGTYTTGASKGIYKYKIDANGKLSKVGLMATANNPSFLAKTRDNKTLIAVEETNENGTGAVKSFKILKDTLVFVNKSKSGGAHPCFVNVNDKNEVLVANYTGGNVGYLKIDDANGLTNLLAIQQHTGKGTTSRQEAPHAHSTWFHPNKKEVVSVDLGTNELWFSAVLEDEKTFAYTPQKTLKMEAGAGPRHLAFHPNKNWMYVLNELNNTVSLIKEKEEVYFIDTTITMLPKDYSEYSSGADIHISNDGKFLYASNRGHNSIVIYKVNAASGLLTLVGFENTRGTNPRNFSLTPDNTFLIVANQDANNLISFQRNKETGLLTFVSEISAPKPVCVLF